MKNTTPFCRCLLASGVLACCRRRPRTDESFAKVAERGQQEAGQAVRRRRLQGPGVLRHRHPRLAGRLHPDRQQPHPRHARPARPHCRRHALPRQGRGHRAGTGRGPAQDRTASARSRSCPISTWSRRPRSRWPEPGTGILAFSNQFQIATRDEPMSVQRGVIAAYSKLYGRIGIFEAPYTGNVYVIDAITNNPGAGGGVITTRKGELLGIIGKELRNELTDTWINYAVPIQRHGRGASARTARRRPSASLDVVDEEGEVQRRHRKRGQGRDSGGYHGIVLVPNVVERTPPYIEEVVPDSPADKARLKPDDLIVYVDGLPVPDINAFKEILGTLRARHEVKLEIQRGDKLHHRDVEAGEEARRARRSDRRRKPLSSEASEVASARRACDRLGEAKRPSDRTADRTEDHAIMIRYTRLAADCWPCSALAAWPGAGAGRRRPERPAGEGDQGRGQEGRPSVVQDRDVRRHRHRRRRPARHRSAAASARPAALDRRRRRLHHLQRLQLRQQADHHPRRRARPQGALRGRGRRHRPDAHADPAQDHRLPPATAGAGAGAQEGHPDRPDGHRRGPDAGRPTRTACRRSASASSAPWTASGARRSRPTPRCRRPTTAGR